MYHERRHRVKTKQGPSEDMDLKFCITKEDMKLGHSKI